jgi:hypothetical protein
MSIVMMLYCVSLNEMRRQVMWRAEARGICTDHLSVCHAGKPDVVVTEDEEYKRVNFDKFKKLSTVFQACTSLVAYVACDANNRLLLSV